ncbi:divalent metal cation transporter [Streptantibioticus rubrisoli]|uniref:divalent metal cation transporter n=1 Tax=Streptantibioticus rubrisoli TaxID=1387313 RepID=UPI00210BF5EA|nr:divalent metal cation transporter [Streptantibioticus rubrisoli]
MDAALVGANAVALATTYTLGDTVKKRHSLHWKISEAPVFYVGYAALIGISATITLVSNDHVQGLITQGVQALAGVLLPSATVFLVLLCNDRPVPGPWVNSVRQNIVAGIIVWALVLLSLALTAATFFPDLTTAQLELGFGIGTVVGIVGGAFVALRSRATTRAAAAREGTSTDASDATGLAGPDRGRPNARRSSTPTAWSGARPTWPRWSGRSSPPLRKAGLITLRGYLLLAVILVIVKIAQLAAGS